LAAAIPLDVRKGNKTMYIFQVHLYLNVQVALKDRFFRYRTVIFIIVR